MWTFFFIAITFSLLLLPLLPSLNELRLATDIKPLKVVQEYDNNVQYFADGLKSYLEKNFDSFFAQPPAEYQEGKLGDGTSYQVLGNNNALRFNQKELRKRSTNRLVLSSAPLELPGGMIFETEVYGKQSVQAGTQSWFRALLADGDIELGKECTVLRWVHTKGSILAGNGCSLFGRASAEQDMFITDGCHFQRLNAARIIFGAKEITPPAAVRTDLVKLETLSPVKERYKRRWIIDDNLEIPDNRFFDGDIVSTKAMHIGAGSHISGSLKSNRDMYLAAGVQIDGAVVSAGGIYIERGCRVIGPVLAEEIILIEPGCIIGSETSPSTVSAPKIQIAVGSMVYGTVWAEEAGLVAMPEGKRA